MNSSTFGRCMLMAGLFGVLFYAGVQHWPWVTVFGQQLHAQIAQSTNPPFLLRLPFWLLQKFPVLIDQVGHYIYALGFAPLTAALVALAQQFTFGQFLGWSAGLFTFFLVASLGLVFAIDLLLAASFQRIAWEFASAFFTPIPFFLVIIYFRLQKLFKAE